MHERNHDITAFYTLLDELAARTGGARQLGICSRWMDWPARGVYFFFEPGEMRGDRQRVVRIGTHALTPSSRTTLWKRLGQHRGTVSSAGGNHRGSIFRLLIGDALMRRDGSFSPRSWGASRPSDPYERSAEKQLEAQVSEHIWKTSVLVLPVPVNGRVKVSQMAAQNVATLVLARLPRE